MAARCLGRGVVRLLGGLRGVGARGLAAPRLWGSASAPAAPAGSYQERIALAASEPAAFWGPLARDVLVWDTPYHTVSDCDFRSGRIGWFLGGQLNVSVNCLDQHVRKSPESVALIWEQDEPGTEVRITYRELLETTCRLANTLKRHGVHRGDRVAIYMPVSPLAVAAMLACARIGAIHTVVFAGFSAGSLAARINDAKCKVVITFNQGLRGGRVVELKKIVDEAIKLCPTVQHVLVAHRTDNKVHMGDLDIPLEQEMAKEEPVCAPESMGSEDTLFLLYTSGSTGTPKGLVHTQAGYLLYAAVTHRFVFDYRPGDVFGCVADIGWITGHSYVVYGPLCNGATSVLFESTPVYPDAGRYWEMVQRLKINQFYGAPTAFRLLLKFEDSWVKKYDRSSLRTLGSVGEPINHEAWEWLHRVVGDSRCTLVDTWWQTGFWQQETTTDVINMAEVSSFEKPEKTGGICISPRPSEEGAEILPCMAMRPLFGIVPVLMDEKGNVLKGGDVSGALCLSQAWPGMARTIFGDHQRFMDAYFKAYPGYYFTGDGAYRTEDGYYQITGRMDDVINISGHRLGTAEIEDAMADHPAVPETAVIGYPHDIKGEAAFAFIVLKDDAGDADVVVKELRSVVASKIAKYAVPDQVLVVKRLPKTRSGKVMRRLLRKIVTGGAQDLGDITTMEDPTVITEILSAYQEYKDKWGAAQ
ncbi:acetyl-coenzyme A synthetase 2-like, mitochondrial isoform X1 [Sagmatias obliquidens]|uniref:acetyl-coenzyme A synthetase 2-like, mitochondrial isoform X1 n=1 Tax=Sagmatias obliquidens TaxID=3371155 RepID=UPI000F445F98|nr:acetyl-coenzyme A synthetase 2-like, mitochondrial isoform X1 [Lagenorhynchus obliquidens]XP_026973919.1 acetyl-coenzyme A synthetase 2-like, mitochondrial isoform X1 [Lagenorhynchus obliquidens]